MDAMALPLPEAVRRHCAAVAAGARRVRIDLDAPVRAGGAWGLDPGDHFLEGGAEEVARYVLVLDAINFGSGWFGTLGADGPATGTATMTRRLSAHARARGEPWTAAELRELDAGAVAAVLGESPGHPLMGLYARGLRQLGGFLGERGALDAIAGAGGSAARFAASLADAMPFFDDRGFYKRAQIAANDVVLAGVADFADVDRLTVFADDLLPHVLRVDGVLVYDDRLAARVDAGLPLAAGGEPEREIRACAVHACEALAERLGVAPRLLDNWLWHRGHEAPYRDRRAHLTRTVSY